MLWEAWCSPRPCNWITHWFDCNNLYILNNHLFSLLRSLTIVLTILLISLELIAKLLNSLTLQFIFFLFGRFGLRIFLSLYTSVFAINAALFQLFFFFLFRKLPLDLIVGFLGISLLFLLFAECQFIARLLDFG